MRKKSRVIGNIEVNKDNKTFDETMDCTEEEEKEDAF